MRLGAGRKASIFMRSSRDKNNRTGNGRSFAFYFSGRGEKSRENISDLVGKDEKDKTSGVGSGGKNLAQRIK